MEDRSRGEELRDSPFGERVPSDDQHIFQESSGKTLQHEWTKLAVAIDRAAFIAYALIFATSAMVYSV